MANDEHVALLKQGVAAWNEWRNENAYSQLDLSGEHFVGVDLSNANLSEVDLRRARLDRTVLAKVNLSRANLSGASLDGADLRNATLMYADLSGANLSGARLSYANLQEADLSKANLRWANLYEAGLYGANLSGANLLEADLSGGLRGANLMAAKLMGACLIRANLRATVLHLANFSGADLSGANLEAAYILEARFFRANLSGASLQASTLLESDLTGADITGCCIYGVSAWRLKLEGAKQQNLVITPRRSEPAQDEPEITVDNIEVAQFVYLLLNNEKIRDVIDTITSKAVLILGRFTDERKAVLDALREELRKRDYLPILFDFEKPRSRDTDETITLLARMARFVIADISDAKAVLQELRAIVPDLPSVPVQSIILATQEEPGMFDFYRNRSSFLTVHRYADQEQLLADLGDKVIRPAELKVRELRG